jgi:hypothetical protein
MELKMKASIRKKYCLPNQIKVESIDKPIPKENEVLIKIYATTVNRTDCSNLTAKPIIIPPKKADCGVKFTIFILILFNITSKCRAENYNLATTKFRTWSTQYLFFVIIFLIQLWDFVNVGLHLNKQNYQQVCHYL